MALGINLAISLHAERAHLGLGERDGAEGIRLCERSIALFIRSGGRNERSPASGDGVVVDCEGRR